MFSKISAEVGPPHFCAPAPAAPPRALDPPRHMLPIHPCLGRHLARTCAVAGMWRLAEGVTRLSAGGSDFAALVWHTAAF